MADNGKPDADATPQETPQHNHENGQEKPPVAMSYSKDEKCTDELDELLDSALADFDEPIITTASSSPRQNETNAKDVKSAQSPPRGASLLPDQELMFNDVFNREMATMAGDAMNAAFSAQSPEMREQFQNLLSAGIAGGEDGSVESQQKFFESLQKTMKAMSDNAQDIDCGGLEDDLAKAMSELGINPDPSAEGDEDFDPMVQTMMQNLLSKDVLYPSVKKISEQYPDWLVENKDKVESSLFNNYSCQCRLMKQICDEFEADAPEDSSDVKTQRFVKISYLLQEMQEYGAPPPDIVRNLGGGLEFDESGLLKIPGLTGDQCSVM